MKINKSGVAVLTKQTLPGRYLKWDEESIIIESCKFNSKSEWIELSPYSYQACKVIGGEFFNSCTSHMARKEKIKGYSKRNLSKKNLLRSAKKFATKSEWAYGDFSSYATAIKNKSFFKLCCSHMKVIRKRSQRKTWTKDELILDAKKYSSRIDWHKASRNCFKSALLKGRDFFQECCSHMQYLRKKKWGEEELIQESGKYRTRSEWHRMNSSSYRASIKKGSEFYQRCCSHMVPVKGNIEMKTI